MIRWQYQQQCVVIVVGGFQCGNGDGWGGVVVDWFKDDCGWFGVNLLQLFGGDEMVFFVGDYQWFVCGDWCDVFLGGLQYCQFIC